MPSTITNSNKTHVFHTLPVSATAGVTDADIAFLSRFLVRSTNKTGGLPLEYPRRSIDKNQIGRVTHAPSSRTAGFERLRKVLDALVGIAVCGDTQRLALSVSLGAKVRITIAQNDECPPPKISEHLQNVWNQLRELANMQRSIRHQCQLPVVLDLPEAAESSLPMANPVNQRLKSLKFRLQADIHQHCYMKSKQRISKYLGPFSQFYTFYIRTKGVFDPELVIADILFCLADISETVTEYKGKFDESGRPVDMKWSYLAKMSNVLLQFYLKDAVNVTARINDVMAAWRSRSEVKAKQDLYTFDLMRALEKTVALHRLILELVSFAYSPRRWPILERELEVLLLRPATLEPAEPSADDMRRIVERAFNATPFATTRRIEQLQDMRTNQLDMARDTDLAPFSVHAEYTLLLHHHSETHDIANPPPLRYIAVNKKPCFSCRSAYKGYTQITGRIFSLRGSHSKLDFPACATTHQLEEPLGTAMRMYLYSELVALYSEHLNHIQDARDVELHTDNGVLADSDEVSASRRRRKKMQAEMDIGQEVLH